MTFSALTASPDPHRPTAGPRAKAQKQAIQQGTTQHDQTAQHTVLKSQYHAGLVSNSASAHVAAAGCDLHLALTLGLFSDERMLGGGGRREEGLATCSLSTPDFKRH